MSYLNDPFYGFGNAPAPAAPTGGTWGNGNGILQPDALLPGTRSFRPTGAGTWNPTSSDPFAQSPNVHTVGAPVEDHIAEYNNKAAFNNQGQQNAFDAADWFKQRDWHSQITNYNARHGLPPPPPQPMFRPAWQPMFNDATNKVGMNGNMPVGNNFASQPQLGQMPQQPQTGQGGGGGFSFDPAAMRGAMYRPKIGGIGEAPLARTAQDYQNENGESGGLSPNYAMGSLPGEAPKNAALTQVQRGGAPQGGAMFHGTSGNGTNLPNDPNNPYLPGGAALNPSGAVTSKQSFQRLPGAASTDDLTGQQIAMQSANNGHINWNAGAMATGGTLMPGQMAIVGDRKDGKPTGNEEGIIAHPGGGVTVIPNGQLPNFTKGMPRFNGGLPYGGGGATVADAYLSRGGQYGSEDDNLPQAQSPVAPAALWSSPTLPSWATEGGGGGNTPTQSRAQEPTFDPQPPDISAILAIPGPAQINNQQGIPLKGLPGELPQGYTPSPLFGGFPTPINPDSSPESQHAAHVLGSINKYMEHVAQANPEWAWQQEQARQGQAWNNAAAKNTFDWTHTQDRNKELADLTEKMFHNSTVAQTASNAQAGLNNRQLLSQQFQDKTKADQQALKDQKEEGDLQAAQAKVDHLAQIGVIDPDVYNSLKQNSASFNSTALNALIKSHEDTYKADVLAGRKDARQDKGINARADLSGEKQAAAAAEQSRKDSAGIYKNLFEQANSGVSEEDKAKILNGPLGAFAHYYNAHGVNHPMDTMPRGQAAPSQAGAPVQQQDTTFGSSAFDKDIADRRAAQYQTQQADNAKWEGAKKAIFDKMGVDKIQDLNNMRLAPDRLAGLPQYGSMLKAIGFNPSDTALTDSKGQTFTHHNVMEALTQDPRFIAAQKKAAALNAPITSTGKGVTFVPH